MFARWGRFVYRFRWPVLLVSVILLGLSIFGVTRGGNFQSGNTSLKSSLEAARASRLITDELNPAGSSGGSSFLLIFKSNDRLATDPSFRSDVEAALAPIQSDPRVTDVITPYNAKSQQEAAAFISKDGHMALVNVSIKSEGNFAVDDYAALRSKVHSSSLSVVGTGQVPLNHAFNTTLEKDLNRAETVSLPVTLLLLLIIFATVVAASLPLGVGIFTILGGVAGTFALSRVTDVSQYALNIVTLIGLAVAIDYSLFVVNRFRDELALGKSREDAISRTLATAGRAITFSGIAVGVGLSAMLFYSGTFLTSLGQAGTIVVATAIFYGLTFLPAVLSLLGPRVNRLRLPIVSRRPVSGKGLWHRLAIWVMRRPIIVLVPTLGFLLLAGSPFLHLRLANADVDQLPPKVEARQGYDTLVKSFPGQDQTSFTVVVNYPDGNPLTPQRIGDQYDLAQRLAAIPNVIRVQSVFAGNQSLSRSDYQKLLSGDRSHLPPALQQGMVSVGKHIVIMSAITSKPASSDDARTILRQIRTEHVGNGGQLLVTGQTAFDVDVINYILSHTPIAVAFVILVTYIVLFLLTGSMVLPLKAVILNLMSISASFGALVWIFQDGHLSQQLNFTPQSIDPTIPVILFAIVFGMSMDYEVLLVSRIHEEYMRTGDNGHAVAEGLERSGRLITGAAAIMVAVFLAFGLADVLIIKSIGLGLAIAVALDATIVRALIVPSVMRLLGHYNWWAPGFLQRIQRRAGLSEFDRLAEELT